jgi:predicted transcriptional regulator
MEEIDHRLSKFFKLLGNGLRLEMARNLLEQRYYVRELANSLSRTEKTISKHLRVFRDQDIVESITENGRRYYWIKRTELVREALKLRNHFERD